MAIKDPKTKSLISYYEVLNISPQADDEDVRRAWHGMAKRYHPDNNPQNRRVSELRLKLINDAYSQLKTREARARYNRDLRLQANSNDNPPQARPAVQPSWFTQIAGLFMPPKPSRGGQ